MAGPAWTLKEITCFLHWTEKMSARSIAMQLGRSVPAVMGMRRKLKRLQELGAGQDELPQLLAINEMVVKHCSLPEIRRYKASVGIPLVQVKHYLRRGRETGKPHLVEEHVRAPVEKPE